MTPALSPRKPRPVLTGAPPCPQGECSVRVVSRFRPPITEEEQRDWPAFRVHAGGRAVEACDGSHRFELDRAFDEAAAQGAVYDCAGRPAVEAVLGGYNGTVLAYGPTGGGKSHSMVGPGQATGRAEAPEELGVVSRAAQQLFEQLGAGAEGDAEFTLRCSFLEVHREQMRDLLNPSTRKLTVKELPQRGLFVDGLSREYTTCASEVLGFLRAGSRLRAVARTRHNQTSSRSHAVFALHLEQRSIGGTERLGKLTLVDLAGSEKTSRSGCAGESLEDAKKINWSLSALGKVIDALAEQRPHVPYRDSQLTRVLEEALGGNCRTTLLVAASACSQHQEETLSSLRFATRAQKVQNHARVNYMYSCEQLVLLVAQLQGELAAVRRQLARAAPPPAVPRARRAPEAEARLGPSGSAPALGLAPRRAGPQAARARRRRSSMPGGGAPATPGSSSGEEASGSEPEERAWRPLALAAREAARPLEAALAAQEAALEAAGLLAPAFAGEEEGRCAEGDAADPAARADVASERLRALRQQVAARSLRWHLQIERHHTESLAVDLALRQQYIDELEWSLEESSARLAEMRHDTGGREVDPGRRPTEQRGGGLCGAAMDAWLHHPAAAARSPSAQPGAAGSRASLAARRAPQITRPVLRRCRTAASVGVPGTPEQGRRDGAADAPAPRPGPADADAGGGLALAAPPRPPSGDVGGTEAESSPTAAGAAAPAAGTGDAADLAAPEPPEPPVAAEEARARLEVLRRACGALEGRSEQLRGELALRGEQLTQLAAELGARGVRAAALRQEAAVKDALLSHWHEGAPRRAEGGDELVEGLLEQALSPLAAILTREQTAAAAAADERAPARRR